MKCHIEKDTANDRVKIFFYNEDNFYTESQIFPRNEYSTKDTLVAYTILTDDKYQLLKENILTQEKPKKEKEEELGALAATRAHLNDLRGIVQYFMDKTKGNN